MGSTEEAAKENQYPVILGEMSRVLGMLFGSTETLCSYNTYQFSDYSRYEVADFVESLRAEQRDKQFPLDLEAAYALGRRLVGQAQDVQNSSS